MRNILTCLFLLFSAAIGAEEPVTAKENNLCSPDEQVVFFCKTENKIAAICASKNLSNSTGFAQYRIFDIGKNTIDFVFPEKPTPPGRNFIMETQPLPGGIDVKIKFSNNGFLYVIHERDAPVSGEGFEGRSEIIVRRDKETPYSITCLNDDSEIRRAGYENFFTQD